MTLFDAMHIKCKMCGQVISSGEDFARISIEVTPSKSQPTIEWFFLCECCGRYFKPPFHFE